MHFAMMRRPHSSVPPAGCSAMVTKMQTAMALPPSTARLQCRPSATTLIENSPSIAAASVRRILRLEPIRRPARAVRVVNRADGQVARVQAWITFRRDFCLSITPHLDGSDVDPTGYRARNDSLIPRAWRQFRRRNDRQTNYRDAKTGERNPDLLCEGALEKLRGSLYGD